MRRLAFLLLCALSSASRAFSPSPDTQYVIVTPSELSISGVGGKTIDCGLSVPPNLFLNQPKFQAVFECTDKVPTVKFELKPGSSTSWYIVLTQSPVGVVPCYLHELTVSGGVPKNQFEWVCTGKNTDGSVFQAKDKSGSDPTQVALAGSKCGLHGSTTQTILDGWATQFAAAGDCANPYNHVLTVLTRDQYNQRVADTTYTDTFTSDGCSAGTNDRWNQEFRPSCVKHDNCYTNPWGAKDACDTLFKDDMTSYCKATYDYWHYTDRQTCLLNKDLYYTGVQVGGQASFDNDQQMLHNSIINGHRWMRYSAGL